MTYTCDAAWWRKCVDLDNLVIKNSYYDAVYLMYEKNEKFYEEFYNEHSKIDIPIFFLENTKTVYDKNLFFIAFNLYLSKQDLRIKFSSFDLFDRYLIILQQKVTESIDKIKEKIAKNCLKKLALFVTITFAVYKTLRWLGVE